MMQRRNTRVGRAFTLVEVLCSAIIVGFILIGAATLTTAGETMDQHTRMFSYDQENLRTALRSITRTIRHSYGVEATSTLGVLNGLSSSSSQLICNVPQPAGGVNCDIIFYVSGGTLYYEKSTDSAPTSLMANATSISFSYYTTTAGVVAAASADNLATEVQITLTTDEGNMSTSAQAYVALRN